MADSMGGLLTKGLGGDCTALIVGFFRLKLTVTPAPPQPPPGGGGGGAGPSTGPAPTPSRWRWRDQDDDDDYEPPPVEQKTVTLLIKLADHYTIRREYIVSPSRAKKAVATITAINKAIQRMEVTFKRSTSVRFIRRVKAKFINKSDD